MPPAPLSPPRILTTTHTPSGTSIIASSTTITPFHPFGPTRPSFAIFYATPSVPYSNITTPEPAPQALPRCPPGGTLFSTTDFPPGASALMHRTQSLDYACVLAGKIVLKLDGGEEEEVGVGGCMVQRGTNHAWENRGDEVCRILFVMVGAEKVVLEGGEVLEETVLKK